MFIVAPSRVWANFLANLVAVVLLPLLTLVGIFHVGVDRLMSDPYRTAPDDISAPSRIGTAGVIVLISLCYSNDS